MTRVASILTRWPFLTALTILLLNDFWLKARFPGLVTGKVSDFAGIAVIALPLLAAFPSRARAIYLAIAAAFLWWKSPLSASFIGLANEWLPYRTGRVVDYTDLLALLVLPLCSLATRDRRGGSAEARRRGAVPVALAAAFATAATSYIPPEVELTIRNIDPAIALDRAAAADAIEFVMWKHRLRCGQDCAERERKGSYSGKNVYVRYHFPADNAVHFSFVWYAGMFGDGETRRVARVKEALKAEFTKRFKGTEAIEPLRDPYDRAPRPCVSEAHGAPHCTATGQDTPTEAPP